MVNAAKRIADALEHIAAPALAFKHDDCAICLARTAKPAAKMRGVVPTNARIREIETGIRNRRLMSGPEEPEAGSEAFRYRERQRWAR